MPRYGYFDSEFPHVTVSTTFDRKQFGEIELIGTLMQYYETQKSFWDRIGVGGSVTSAPAFWNDMLFFGALDNNFYCLTADGEEKWRFRTNGAIQYDASVHNGVVFFESSDHNVYALDCLTGKLIWKFSTNGPGRGYILVHDGVVYAGSFDHNVYAIDEKTGKELWRIPTLGAQVGVFEKDDILYFGYRGGIFYAYDIKSRRRVWALKMQKDANGWKECFWGNNVYIGSWEGNTYALDRKTGNIVWKFSAGDVTFPPYASGNRIYFGSFNSNVYCLEAETGKLIWKFRTGGGLVSNLIESGGKVYFGSYDYNVYCLDAVTGLEIWRFRTNGFVDSVSKIGNRLFFGSWDCHMYCVDSQTGKLVWKFKTNLGTPSPIEPPETGMVRSAEVVWRAPEQAAKEKKQGEAFQSDYAAGPGSEYASAVGSDYLGKKKRGYV